MILIVGAGLTGCVIAQNLYENNKEVKIIERLNHIGGLCYESEGVHRYGPHFFHTNNQIVWDYLSRFTEWTQYTHIAKTEFNGKLLPIPANLETLIAIFGESLNFETFKEVPEILFDTLYKEYSMKQWGKWFEEIDIAVFNRLPIRFNNEERYFTDKFQALPKYGYTEMLNKMVQNIEIELNSTSLDGDWEHIFYTGPIDAFYDYQLGRLPYKSILFEEYYNTTLPVADLKSPSLNIPYTRSIDYRYITGAKIMIREYPLEEGLEMYPVPTKETKKLFTQYQRLQNNNITFCGRLGKYHYFNMDEAVADALKIVQNYLYYNKISSIDKKR